MVDGRIKVSTTYAFTAEWVRKTVAALPWMDKGLLRKFTADAAPKVKVERKKYRMRVGGGSHPLTAWTRLEIFSLFLGIEIPGFGRGNRGLSMYILGVPATV